jgi:hypothetical protein
MVCIPDFLELVLPAVAYCGLGNLDLNVSWSAECPLQAREGYRRELNRSSVVETGRGDVSGPQISTTPSVS